MEPSPASAAATTGASDTDGGGKTVAPILRKRVRVIGKIIASSDLAVAQSVPSSKCGKVSVLKSGEGASAHATVVFGDDDWATGGSYKLDWCYEPDESIDKLFSDEVKPLIQGVSQGKDATIFAFGARGSGKTLLIEGCEEKFGLAPLAMAEILDYCKDNKSLVRISCYEVYQDHIFDLLEQKDQEVHVLEDASGRIQLKGLSQLHIESISDFNRLYFHGRNQRNISKKVHSNVPCKSHKGLIMHICPADGSNLNVFGKINFVDLAGYEDTAPKSNARPLVLEMARLNKSLHALQNVVCALNSNEVHIPFRGCKLTYLLKDSLSKEKNQTLMITCLKTSPSQETIRAVSMASNSCLVANLSDFNSSSKSKSKPRPTPSRSPSTNRHQMLSAPSNKHGVSRFALLDKKSKVTLSATKGRKLFGAGSPITKCVKDNSLSCSQMNQEFLEQNENKSSSDINTGVELLGAKMDKSSFDAIIDDVEPLLKEERGAPMKDVEELESKVSINLEDGAIWEISEPFRNTHESSPPISERLREISNSLKLLSCQPLQSVTTFENYSCSNQDLDSVEPKTPGVLSNFRANHIWDVETPDTPQEIFKTRSTGLKKLLAQELLNYLNTATKEELKELKGIGDKRADLILELRAETPQPFKDMNDLKEVGLSSKQVKEMMKCILGDYFT